jgi:hypothetical protein
MYITSPINPDHNDHKIRLAEKLIWEVCELGSTTRRQDKDALKHFTTQESVTVRRPWGHFDMDKPALASFIGTMNDDGAGFLDDSTGNRRYRPVYLTAINWFYEQECHIDQIWAEAVALYKQGETSKLTEAEEQQLQNDILPQHETINLMDDLIALCFDHVTPEEEAKDHIYFLNAVDILLTIERQGYVRRNNAADFRELARGMKKAGFEKYRTGVERGYRGIYAKNISQNKGGAEL